MNAMGKDERMSWEGKVKTPRKVLAVASGGGHWEQLMLLRSTLDEFQTVYVTTDPVQASRDNVEAIEFLPDANRNRKLDALRCLWASLRLVRRMKPDVVITTGAMPGLIVIAIGRLFGAKGIWLDSIANSETLSTSGRWAVRLADISLTQWPHLSSEGGAVYRGTLL